MAYMNVERKRKLAPKIKQICKKYGIRGTLAINNNSTLVLNIKSGKIDFIGNHNEICGKNDHMVSRGFTPVKNYLQVNEYWYHEHFSGKAKAFLGEVISAMNIGNHDNSRPEIDHFDVGWYVNINVGKWNKPYIVE